MTFLTERGLYYYKVMPYVLMNARATYQRLMNKMFKELNVITMEVYIDDMYVKWRNKQSHIEHLREFFDILRKIQNEIKPD